MAEKENGRDQGAGYLNVVIRSNEYLMDGYPCTASQPVSRCFSLFSLSVFQIVYRETEREKREREREREREM